jgi:hypothetical protein
MNTRAPKAPPMMGPIGSFDSEFPCTETASVALDVGLDEEDSSVENDEELDSVEDDEEGDNTGEFDVVDEVVVVELRKEVVGDDEGLLGVPSTIK